MQRLWILVLVGMSVVCACKRAATEVQGQANASIQATPDQVGTVPSVTSGVSLAGHDAPTEAELELVANKKDAFDGMLESLLAYSGANGAATTNAIDDIDSFFAGRSDDALFEFAARVRNSSPYASMQVYHYLAHHAQEPAMMLDASHRYTHMVGRYGDEEDLVSGNELFRALLDRYADPAWMGALTPDEREKVVMVLQNHTVVLMMGDDALRDVVTVLRNHGQTAVEASYADYYDAMTRIWSGDPNQLAEARDLMHKVQERDVYGRYNASKDDVEFWLGMNDEAFGVEAMATAEGRAMGLVMMKEQWRQLQAMAPGDKVNKHAVKGGR